MSEQDFWQLFETARQQAGDAETYLAKGRKILQALLEKLSADDIVAFHRMFRAKKYAAYRWDLWGAAFVIRGGCGDDTFSDFRSELISRGQAVYEAALADPESLVDVEPTIHGIEGWQYVAGEAFTAKTGEDDIPFDEMFQPAKPAGKKWEEDDLPKLLPKLSAAFG